MSVRPVLSTPRQRWRKPALLSGSVLALAALLSACGYGSQAATTGSTVQASGKALSASTVRIGYFGNITHTTPLVGVENGRFQKDLGGTKLQTQIFNAGPSEIEALNAGSIDIGWIGPSPAISGYSKSKGTSLRIISGSVSGGASLVVNPSKIKSIADLKGKRIASPQLGNTQDVALLNFLSQHGFKEDAQSGKGDVSVVRTDNSLTPTEFKSDQIDGAWVPEPTASKLVAAGGKTLVDEKSLWPGGRFVTTNVIVSQKFLKAHPDVVEAVLKASVDTNDWIAANPAEAKKTANQALAKLTGKPLPTVVLDDAWKNIEVTDDPLASTLKTEAQHAVTAGLLSAPDLSGIYDLTPLNKVLKAAGKPAVSAAGLGTQ
ncbi:ABC transporter substrate-binding protein [Phaeacidiphilus oryzae]|uniref:ABC transporter substrate-binding protein n=1 Tax=Phaeacidiphilus oryzae TaxID=348818 RepID=UPI00056BBD7B|nr:ABC transporter substrate-binding protein [Phaeacidiphilus oryzae]